MKTPRSHFSPQLPLDERRINVDRESGRIAARIASWDSVYSGTSIRVPRNINVDAAHIGDADTDEGTIKVGVLSMDTVHAGDSLTAAQAAEWYANTGKQVAKGVYSVDDTGIRFDGVLYSDLEEAKLERLTASAPSGDWRWKAAARILKPADMEHAPSDFAGACIVSVPGFSDTYSKDARTAMSLVASAESDEMLLYEDESIEGGSIEVETVEDNSLTAAADPKPCGEECDTCTCGEPNASEDVDRGEALVAAAALLAEYASEHGADLPDVVASLTAASSAPEHPERTDIEFLTERVEQLEQLVHDAILGI